MLLSAQVNHSSIWSDARGTCWSIAGSQGWGSTLGRRTWETPLAEPECAEECWGSGAARVGGKGSRDALSVVWSLAGALVQRLGAVRRAELVPGCMRGDRADRGRVGPPEL